MSVLFIIALASIMAVLGIVGYQWGTRAISAALVILLAAFAVVERYPGKIVTLMNGLYMGTMLVFKSGLSDIAGGNVEAAGQKLSAIQKPFVGPREGLALLVVILAAVVIGLLLSRFRWLKGPSSVLAALLGLAYGYVLSASFLPGLFRLRNCVLPVPVIRSQSCSLAETAQAAAVTATGEASPVVQFLSRLVRPGDSQMVTLAVMLVLGGFLAISTRLASKKG